MAVEGPDAVGAFGGGGAVGVQGQCPAPAVNDHQMVEVAEQGQVVQAGRAAFGPRDQVVHVTADGRGGAAGEGAVPVALDDGAAQVRRDLLGGLAEVQGQAG